MAYVGQKPATTLTMPTSQYFNGDGSTTAFTLNKSVTVGEELEVFVDNVQQEPGTGKSYTATGTTLTFDAAPSSGTDNVYVVYRGLSQFNARLEHDPNAALAATTGTFSGDLTVDTDTLYVDSTNNSVGIGTTSPSTSHRLTLDKSSNYGGIELKQSGTQVGQIIQEGGTGNVYIDADSSSVGGGLIFRTTGGTTRMTVDGSGRVTMPYQPYAKCSYSGGNLSPVAIIPLNTNQVTRGGVTIASNRITVPVTGVYMVGYHHLANAGGLQVGVKKNGTAVQGSYAQEVSGANGNFSAQTIVELSANDYIEFEAIANGSLHGNSTYNSMWLFLLG